ncbi:MAG: AtpZ/AtpI family protein [Rhodospirillaceae bacterium]|nr:AtpZ/AtpI family protein [Rhodospirillaceae bacterium]
MSDHKPDHTLEDLGVRLKRARDENEHKTRGRIPGSGSDMSGFGMAIRIGSELVAALIVGVGFGLLLDYWLDTSPWFLVVFFFLGAGAGVLNVYRAASGIGYAPGYGPAKVNKSADSADNEGSDGT